MPSCEGGCEDEGCVRLVFRVAGDASEEDEVVAFWKSFFMSKFTLEVVGPGGAGVATVSRVGRGEVVEPRTRGRYG